MRKYVGSGQLYCHWQSEEKCALEKVHYSNTNPLFGKFLLIYKLTLEGN